MSACQHGLRGLHNLRRQGVQGVKQRFQHKIITYITTQQSPIQPKNDLYFENEYKDFSVSLGQDFQLSKR